MSFYSGSRNSFCPGPMQSNPLNGLCEKACIHTKKVFDACVRQIQESDVQLQLTNNEPENPTGPLTFTSMECVGNEVAIENLQIERFEDKPCFARVSGTINIPVIVNYTDAKGIAGKGKSNINVNTDVVLYVPQPSIVPVTVEAYANCITPDGEYIGDNMFSVDSCLSIILRVMVEADILVPTYGYCPIPPCQEYTQDACSGFFDLPLFPAQQPVCNA